MGSLSHDSKSIYKPAKDLHKVMKSLDGNVGEIGFGDDIKDCHKTQKEQKKNTFILQEKEPIVEEMEDINNNEMVTKNQSAIDAKTTEYNVITSKEGEGDNKGK